MQGTRSQRWGRGAVPLIACMFVRLASGTSWWASGGSAESGRGHDRGVCGGGAKTAIQGFNLFLRPVLEEGTVQTALSSGSRPLPTAAMGHLPPCLMPHFFAGWADGKAGSSFSRRLRRPSRASACLKLINSSAADMSIAALFCFIQALSALFV